jgi:hypothetical protein
VGILLEGCGARYPVGCGAEEAEESGGGGGAPVPGKLISFLRHCYLLTLPPSPSPAAVVDRLRARHGQIFGGCAVEWEQEKW